MHKFVSNFLVLFAISILVTSCSGNNQPSKQVEETTESNGTTTASTIVSKASDFNQSLSNENIQGYYGLMWETAVEAQPYSLYFKSLTQRVLFTADYIWVDENNEKQEDPIFMIRKGEDKNNKLLGIKFIEPITSKVTQLPHEISEVWFNIYQGNFFMYLKLKDDKWYSYTLRDGHLKYDMDILETVLDSIEALYSEPA